MPFHKPEQRAFEEETFVSKKFTASKSLLEKYFSGCAHRAYLYKRWNLKPAYMPKPLKYGINVHDLIEKGISGEELYDKETLESDFTPSEIERAERAINWIEKNGYEVLATEVKHLAPLTDEIQLFGVIDVIALDRDGSPVLLDWKTSRALWSPITTEGGEIVYVGSQGWQGPIYLTTPYESSILKPSAWPDKMQYIIIPEFETVGVYDYHKNDTDDQALIQACRVVKTSTDEGNFPKNKGYQCDAGFGCDFKKVCWEQKGWRKYYDPRTDAAQKQYDEEKK